ncbi:MAG: 16S rRNA (cytosine(1402)-N(4))-methyltransferase RsmH [Saprospiraceae bacterium]
MYHSPVLLRESVELLHVIPEGIYVDATFGGGGHSAAILALLDSRGSLYAFDQDRDAHANALQAPFDAHPGFHFVASNFRHLKRQLRALGVAPGTVDGILADLGVSSYQIDTPERGFSYRFDAELDMRMNPEGALRADTVLNTYSTAELQRVFSTYGELRNARTLAQACAQFRAERPFRTTAELVALCDKHRIGERWRYLSQVFQALRMEVNEEVAALADFLREAREMLKPGGRLAVISYHSIEDRLVKNFLKAGNAEGEPVKDFYGNIERPFELLLKKAQEPTDQEIKENPRARSAKLRGGARVN